MPTIAGPAGRLWYELHGDGDPVTLFVHGVTGSTFDLEPLSRATRGTRVLMDLRGHGRSESPPPEAGYDHPALRDDVAAVADHVQASRAFGLSAGAGAILSLLADDPARFARVVLMLPGALDRRPEGAAAAYGPLADQLEAHPVEEVAAVALDAPEQAPLFLARPYWRDLVRERILRMNRDGVPRTLRAYPSGRPPVPDPDVLRRVTASALLIAHEGDPLHDAAVAERLAELLPRAVLWCWTEPLGMYDDLDALARLIALALA